MKLSTVSKWLVLLGALQVGLMGTLGYDFLGSILGGLPLVATVVYALIGLSGLWGAYAMLTKKKK